MDQSHKENDFHVLVVGAGELGIHPHSGNLSSDMTCRFGGVYHCPKMQIGSYTSDLLICMSDVSATIAQHQMHSL